MAELPRPEGTRRVEHRLPEAEQVCRQCHGPLHEKMSTEVRSELAVIPAQVKVIEHVRFVYACRACKREAIETPVVTAPMPAPPIPGSLASPSALAHVMSQTFVEGLPLYRQEQAPSAPWARLGVPLSRQTMANWMIARALNDALPEKRHAARIDTSDPVTLDALLPWSERLPDACKTRQRTSPPQATNPTVA